MSGPFLPDDLRDWPDDPYALFGVSLDVDEKGLRRIYAALIRRFKPEQSPAEFQKIREAYEELRQRLTWRWRSPPTKARETSGGEVPSSSDSGSPEVDGDAEIEDKGVTESDASENPGGMPAPLRSSQDLVRREIRAAWDLVHDGRWSDAHRELTRLALRDPGSEDIAQRLLWLRRLRPELDRTPPQDPDAPAAIDLDSVFGCPIVTPRRDVPAADCLREDFLERIPKSLAAAYSGEADAWWSAPLPAWQRLRFLQARWSAAASHGAFGRIGADFERAREMLIDDHGAWYQALVLALELSHLSAHEDAFLLRQTAQELLGTLRDLELQFSHALDRVDILRDSLARLTLSSGEDDALAILAVKELVGTHFDTRQEVADLVLEWVGDPDRGVKEIDRIGYDLRRVLRRVIDRYAHSRGFDFDPPDSAWLESRLRATPALVAQFRWYMSNQTTYAIEHLHRHLIAFCLRERVLAGHVLEELNRMFGGGNQNFESWCRTIGGDPALAAVVTACLAFWNTEGGDDPDRLSR